VRPRIVALAALVVGDALHASAVRRVADAPVAALGVGLAHRDAVPAGLAEIARTALTLVFTFHAPFEGSAVLAGLTLGVGGAFPAATSEGTTTESARPTKFHRTTSAAASGAAPVATASSAAFRATGSTESRDAA